MRANLSLSTCKSSKQTQHVSACLGRNGAEETEVVVVDDEEVVVVVVCFVFKPPSLLFSFGLLFVAFNSSSSCGDSSDAVAVVVVEVEVDVVAFVVSVFCLASLAPSSSFFFGTGFFCAVAAAAAAASLNFLHSLRCPPFFQWFTWHSRPQY